jgi:hypothetical protein
MAVAALEKSVRRRAAVLDEAELERLGELLERYRAFVGRAAAGESLATWEYAVVEQVLEQLWLPLSCWPRDVAAWRESVAIRARLAGDADGGSASAPAWRDRLVELELLHPHLLCGLDAAAAFRWESGAR